MSRHVEKIKKALKETLRSFSNSLRIYVNMLVKFMLLYLLMKHLLYWQLTNEEVYVITTIMHTY